MFRVRVRSSSVTVRIMFRVRVRVSIRVVKSDTTHFNISDSLWRDRRASGGIEGMLGGLWRDWRAW